MLFLRKSSEYKQVYNVNRRVKGLYFTLLVQDGHNDRGPAFGIVVRGKVGNAVVRNRIKRRVRAFLRNNEKDMVNDIFAVIIAGDSAGKCNWEETVKDLTHCLKRTGVIVSGLI